LAVNHCPIAFSAILLTASILAAQIQLTPVKLSGVVTDATGQPL